MDNKIARPLPHGRTEGRLPASHYEWTIYWWKLAIIHLTHGARHAIEAALMTLEIPFHRKTQSASQSTERDRHNKTQGN